MRSIYIAIEKNIERFELYRVLWNKRGIIGIMAATKSAIKKLRKK